MLSQAKEAAILTVAAYSAARLQALAAHYQLSIVSVADGKPIPGSFWGEPEAGIVGQQVFVRGDTPVHSVLHELSHIVCMDPQRRAVLERNAGGDDAEEAAVCYLQILFADELDDVGSARLMQDMDAWGYSFRLGSTAAWFANDAADARAWLEQRALIKTSGRVTFRLRSA